MNGYEKDFYHDIHQIRLSMGEMNQVLQSIMRILSRKFGVDDN